MTEADTLRLLTAFAALMALFLVAAGLILEWHLLTRAWRLVVGAGLLQQAAIAYAAVEAMRSPILAADVTVPPRVYLLGGTTFTLLIAAVLLIAQHYQPNPEGKASNSHGGHR